MTFSYFLFITFLPLLSSSATKLGIMEKAACTEYGDRQGVELWLHLDYETSDW